MKTALYKYEHEMTKRTIICRITLREDEKISFSILGGTYGLSSSAKYLAKSLGKEIIAKNFKHESVIEYSDSQSGDSLIPQLRKKTTELFDIFVYKRKLYAEKYYKYCEELSKLNDAEMREKFGEVKVIYNFYFTAFVDGKSIRTNERMELSEYGKKEINNARNTVRKNLEEYIASEEKAAKEHYEKSLIKLADRLNKKGVTVAKELEIVSGFLGQNFEITIKHDEGVVRAWTIIAEGPVQRPHYRFLVK